MRRLAISTSCAVSSLASTRLHRGVVADGAHLNSRAMVGSSCPLMVHGATSCTPTCYREQRRWLSATLAGTGLDLGAFRRKYEAELPPVELQPLTPEETSSGKKERKKKGKTADAAAGAGSEQSPTASTPSTSTQKDASVTSARALTAPQPCVVRGRVERSRGHGKIAFLHLRQPPHESVQVVCFGKALAAEAKSIPPESIIEVTGEIRPGEVVPIASTSCAYHEVHATSLRVLSAAATPLPFPLQDVNTRLDTRLNHRAMDLRTRLTSAVLRLVSAVCQSYRTALLSLDFVEVHTPKLIAAASEGGSAVFEVKYFDQSKAYLAQSPQLYKQMCLNGDAMRVFEIGPVFRAEQSLTHRHLTEFTGLDGEMVVKDGHKEVLDVLEHVMCRVLHDLQDTKQPYAALVKTATAALREQQQALSDSEGPAATSVAAAVGAGCSAPESLADIVYELSEDTVARLGLVADVSGGNTTAGVGHNVPHASRDRYRARFGNGTVPHPGGAVPCPRVLRMRFDDAVRLLCDAGEADASTEDFSLPQERKLGELIKARYGVDLYVVDCWPKEARPFYTMPCTREDFADASLGKEENSSGHQGGSTEGSKPDPQGPHNVDRWQHRTRSYDMYLRGEEICSGAQRQHDAEKLAARLAEMGISLSPGDGLSDYVNSFRYGAWPHGGFGLGLERIVSFFLGARDIRQVSLFPRDPRRLTP